jgi:hypothetical protein
MKINEIFNTNPVFDSHALFEADLERKAEIVRNLFKKANKYAKDHHLTDIAAQKAYEKELRDLQKTGIKITDIHKFTGFFRKHPKLIGAAVGILFFAGKPVADTLGMDIGPALNLIGSILAGMYAADIASPLVKTHAEREYDAEIEYEKTKHTRMKKESYK